MKKSNDIWDGKTLENNEKGKVDYEFVAILQHQTKRICIEGGEKDELEYLVKFYS